MATTTFGKGAGQFGLLTSIMAIGSVTGALLAARRAVPRMAVLIAGSLAFGIATALAALAPTYATFAVALIAVGTSAQTFTVTTNSFVQISTEPGMRGRVMAILMAVILGGTPLGAPVIGRISDAFGPRWAMAAGGMSGVTAAVIGALVLQRTRARTS
jgi:predicted MFS family arabinose efflux permease